MKARSFESKPRIALDVTRAVVSHLTDDLSTAVESLRADHPGGVHDVRKAIGRIRGVLAGFRGVLDAREADLVRQRLRALTHDLEPARSATVRVEQAGLLLKERPVDEAPDPVAGRLVEVPEKQVADATESARAAVIPEAVDDVFGMLRAIVDRPRLGPHHADPPRRAMRRMVRKQLRRSTARIKMADATDLPSLHEVRKAVRRVRFLAEELGADGVGVLPPRWARLAAAAHELQDALGDHRDAALYATFLEASAADAALAGEDPLRFGQLAGDAHRRADALLRTYRKSRARYLTAAKRLR